MGKTKAVYRQRVLLCEARSLRKKIFLISVYFQTDKERTHSITQTESFRRLQTKLCGMSLQANYTD
jgi:hypothetical protein